MTSVYMFGYQTVPNPAYGSPNPAYQSRNFPYQVPPSKENVRPSVLVSQYSSSSMSTFRPANAEVTEVDGPKPKARSRRSKFLWHFFSHLISVLWLAPMVALLALNYKGHMIGASVWCPFGKCSAKVFNTGYSQRANKLDRDDHNTLGALQFVAKGLEIWFMFVATALIYDVAMVFARRGGGLPLGYMLTHLEFSDLRNLFSRTLWTSPIPHANSSSARQHVRTTTLYLFAALAAFLTILTNLMGPATAVLALPTLQWVDTPHETDQIFNGTGAAYLPGGDSNSFVGCNNDTLTAHMYSCSLELQGPSLDAWATSAEANVKQHQAWGLGVNLGVSQEGMLDFTLNVSTGSPVIWVPNRQVLRWLSLDWWDLWGKVMGEDSTGPKDSTGPNYDNSLTTVLQRSGPSIGLNIHHNTGNWSEYRISDHKLVVCFTGWTIDDRNYYTKCIQSGAWSAYTQWANFSLENPIPGEENITVVSLFSEKSVYYSDTDDFGSGIISCLDGDVTRCDWDKIFDTEPPQDLRSKAKNVGITVYYHNPNDTLVWFDQVAYLGFPTYQIDLSPNSTSRQLKLIQLNNISNVQPDRTPLAVNPYWLLAAWSVDEGGIVSGSRALAKELAEIMPRLVKLPWTRGSYTEEQLEFFFLHMYAVGQAMSLVNYFYINTTENPSAHADDDHPYLYHFTTLRVWAFGLSGRTSRLGFAVVLAGSFCVLVRLLLGFFMLRHEHSPVELFVAALEHQYQQEFSSLHHENDWAKVRYRMDVGHHGKPTFHPDRSNSWGSPQAP
ncbi:hypothetical protein MMC22_009018 [Lobaria immixta]|nr:hypothetical protein [Lobaria immixta]